MAISNESSVKQAATLPEVIDVEQSALNLTDQYVEAIEAELGSHLIPDSPDVSVIVPTYQEVKNLPLLVPRIHNALNAAGMTCEIIVVDDNSQDGTIEACDSLSQRHPVRLETRVSERGLSTAVIHGFSEARGAILICMDADLSHPPERLPELVRQLTEERADFVIGSRYVKGGSTDGEWGLFRLLNSKIATWLARPLTNASDPMAGFFALSASQFKRVENLDPIGYKIGLELLVKCRCSNVREIPIHFSDRIHGESKLSLKEQLNYIRHLGRLMDFKFRHLARSARFAAVGVTGMAVDLSTYAVGLELLSLPTPAARAIAIWLAMTWNFVLNRRFTFRNTSESSWFKQYGQFCLSCLLGGLLNWTTSVVLTSTSSFFATHALAAAAIGVASGFGLNYVLASEWVFRDREDSPEASK